jgi:hypothetical protein
MWGGADPHGMTRFEERYDSDRTILGQSWRVPKSIHRLSQKVIQRVEKRVEKQYNPTDEEGEIERYLDFSLIDFNKVTDAFILFRNHMIKDEVELELKDKSVPYLTSNGRPGPLQNRYGNAIRIFKRIQAGEEVPTYQIKQMSRAGDDRTKKYIEDNDLKGLIKRGWEQSFHVPFGLIDYYRNVNFEIEPTIKLSTIHGAKGAEAKHVILSTGMTQRTMEESDKDPDSEARVFYVGITRAMHTLTIVEGNNNYDLS